MAIRTSTTSGSWSSSSTWGGSGVPGSADTAVIASGHTVTVADVRTCAGWTQQGTGVLAISATGSLTATGDTLIEGHDAVTTPKVTVAAGGQLLWAPGSGQTITHKSGGNQYRYCGLQARGTSGARCTVGKAAGSAGTLLWRSDYIVLRGGVIDCEFADLDGWGSASADAWTLDVKYDGTIRLHDCRVRGGGRVNLTMRDLGNSGGLIDLADSTWSGTLGGYSFVLFTANNEGVASSASVVRCEFDGAVAFNSDGSINGTLTLTDCLFRASVAGNWPAELVASSGHVFYQTAAVAAAGMYMLPGTHDQCYHFADFGEEPGESNPHFWNPNVPGGQVAIDRCAFDYWGAAGVDVGDVMDHGSGTTLLRRVLVLPATSTDVSHIPAGAIWWLGGGALRLEHCTVYAPGPSALGLHFPHSAVMPAGSVPAVKANLFWSDQPDSLAISSDEGTVGDFQAEDALTPAGVVANAFVGMVNGSNVVGGSPATINGMSRCRFSVAPTGNLTLATGGAQFVDATRNFLTWSRTVRGHTGTDSAVRDAGLADLSADRTLGRMSLLPWVLAGFQPRNPDLYGATYAGDPLTTDAAGNPLGGTIGALSYLVPTSDYSLIAPSPAAGLPGVASGAFTVTLAPGVNPGSVTITPAASGAAATFTPATVTLTDAARSAEFTVTPLAAALASAADSLDLSISATDSATLADPDPVLYHLSYPALDLSVWESEQAWAGTPPHEFVSQPTPSMNADDHYDATRVFQNVRDYTGDPAWDAKIAAAITRFRDGLIRPSGGALQGHHAYSLGLTRDYQRTGDPLSRAAAIMIRRFAAFNAEFTPLVYLDSCEASRECAFAIRNQLAAEDLGYAPGRDPLIHDLAARALDHLDQFTWGSAYSARPAPRPYYELVHYFMIGLTCEALIAYRDRYRDHPDCPAGIPEGIRQALDWAWETGWDATGAYRYGYGIAAAFATTATGAAVSSAVNGEGKRVYLTGDAGLQAVDSYYSGGNASLTFTAGALNGFQGFLSAYVGSTRTFTLDRVLPAAPAPGDPFRIDYRPAEVGTVTAGMTPTATQFTADTGRNSANNYYAYATVTFITGARAGEDQTVIAYVGSTRTFTIAHFFSSAGAPAVGDMFLIRPGGLGDGGAGDLAADLNLLLAPAYAWDYGRSVLAGARDNTGRVRHDAAFAGSTAARGQIFTQKVYNQCYRWSFQGLAWRAQGDVPWPAATALTFTAVGPATGRANAWSGRLRVALAGTDVAVAGPVLVTITDTLPGGAPAGGSIRGNTPLTTDHSVIYPGYRPAAGVPNGTAITLTVTNDGGLTNPAPLTYTVSGTAPVATGYTATGPAGGPIGSASAPFTIALAPAGSVPPAAQDDFGGQLCISPADSLAGNTSQLNLVGCGTLSAPRIALADDISTAQFVYIAQVPQNGPYPGTTTLSFTNEGSLADPAPLTYTAPAPDPPPTSGGRLRLRTAAGVLRLRVGS